MGETREKFSPGVSEELKYYVYRLIDPRNGLTFYVGKGKGNRMFAHARAENGYDGERFGKDEKLETIRDIRQDGREVKYVVHRHGLAEENCALEVEAALIDAYVGLYRLRKVWADEIEAALDDAVAGLKNKVKGNYAKRGEQTVGELETRYAKSDMSIDSDHKLMLIRTKWSTVNDPRHGTVYEAVRRSWRVNKARANRADYVLAVIDGVCVRVFRNCVWYCSPGQKDVPKQKLRYEFKGCEVRGGEIVDRYRDKVVPPGIWPQGATNPIRYVGL